MEEVIKFLNANINPGSKVVVACSGGTDSMCLLSLVKTIPDIEVVVAHVNHGLRVESEEEEKLVRDYCSQNNLKLEVLKLSKYKKEKFTEADGRCERYKFFTSIINKYQAKYLLTAHHGDDLVETILMRLTRGSTLSGYSGIKMVDPDGEYITLRPLLTVTKNEIINYNKINNIPFGIDESNKDKTHTRNRYRREILPFLKKENENVHLKYLKYSEELLAYDKFIRDYIKNKELIVNNYIVIDNLKNENYIVKKKCLEILIEEIQKQDYLEVSDKVMANLIDLLSKDNKSIDIGNSYKAINSYGKFYIEKYNSNIIEEQVLDKDLTINNYIFYYNSKESDNTNSCIRLNSKEVTLPLKVRSKKNGDFMYVKNLGGKKKLSDIFIDEKVPKSKRKTIPVVIDSKNVILWVPFVKKSQFAKDKSEKCDIIIRCKAR